MTIVVMGNWPDDNNWVKREYLLGDRMKESKIEAAVCFHAVKEHNAEVRKLTYVNRKGAPDRMLFFPNGKVMFIEFKQKGKVPRPDQEREIDRMRINHVAAYMVDEIEYGKRLVDIHALSN